MAHQEDLEPVLLNGWKDYMKTGIGLTPPVLLATLLALALWLHVV
jgi:arsenical pump membrane protein